MNAPSVLIVEDDALIALNLSEILERHGFYVPKPESSSEMVLRNIRAGTCPDLVLMDIWLGGTIDGLHTAREIRKLCDIPIIFLTAVSDESRVKEARDISPYGYITKPSVENEILSAVRKALSGKTND